VVLLALAAGCRLPAADHERLGDLAFREGAFGRALAEYQAAQRGVPRARVWAKAGVAALRAREFGAAVDAFQALAGVDPTRAREAAVGLERTVDEALREGADRSVVARAVVALRTVDPARPLGRLARYPAAGRDLPPQELVRLLPAALANSGSGRAVDSLLLRYADALRTTTACEEAARGYQTVLRRADRTRLRGEAEDGLAFCGLQLGLDALAHEQAEAAERWFAAVIGAEPATVRGWRARIGLGDARLALGDALGAAVAYQGVLGAAGVPDSLRVLATERLNALGRASAGDPPGGL
jgi:tetratricopeptide (TPR) repeat protein